MHCTMGVHKFGHSCDSPPSPCVSPSLLPPQRDLDFTIDLDFKGQLCELSCSTDYRMR